jgi:hypothetical protein
MPPICTKRDTTVFLRSALVDVVGNSDPFEFVGCDPTAFSDLVGLTTESAISAPFCHQAQIDSQRQSRHTFGTNPFVRSQLSFR